MGSLFVLLAGLAGFAGVAAGASERHLSGIDQTARDWLTLASQYLLFHAAALLAVSGRLDAGGRGAGFARFAMVCAGLFFAIGMFLFGGGLILLATGWSRLIIVVPFGGTSLLIGWLFVFLAGAVSLVRGRR